MYVLEGRGAVNGEGLTFNVECLTLNVDDLSQIGY